MKSLRWNPFLLEFFLLDSVFLSLNLFLLRKEFNTSKSSRVVHEKIFFLKGGDKMVFLINDSPPSLRELKSVIEIAKYDLDSLDGRELWVYEKYCQGGFK